MQSVFGAYPEQAIPILDDLGNIIGPEGIGIIAEKIIDSKSAKVLVITVQSKGSADPDITFTVLEKACDKVAAQAVGISYFVKKSMDLSRFPLKQMEPIFSANPDVFLIILKQGIYGSIGQPVFTIV